MFSKACQYGIKAVIYIWSQSLKGVKVGAKETAEHVDAPEPFTAKILQELVRKKVIGSQKGPSGGFYAGTEHEKLTLQDLVIAIDGDGLFSGCSLGLKACSETNPCPLHHEIKKVRTHVVSMLTKKTLKELALEVESGETVLARFDV
ncbi:MULTISPECIES: RrF2 family transcriptional regulator [Belliella]|uniref:Transcriptional regulator, BadM/Rrf2 family n=3 Tax=Belliella TaxID=232244 RepID=A0A239AQG2_9BACT|nr:MULTISPECIES: Rrf2 family transcriptional regulator [Belliella]AFL84594.1 putative transcriptional regulator [Belliella baltica DSM 15883]SIS69527.1 transcriptional regulator, BadM/Rrf2 family [Belliella pelovolcani]SNR97542.1 transcriptional regulator, BadM/Rrf2 family [Belliella buryatensis]